MQSMRIPLKAALALLAACCAFVPAWGLTVIPPDFEELVSQADVVVDGEVSSVRTELAEYQGRPLVYTFVSIRVLEAVKGDPGDTIEMRMLGGTVGDFTMQVSGVPEFSAGQRNLFFIAGNGNAFCPLVAVPHGYYPIVRRPSDGVDVVLRSNGEPLVRPEQVSEEIHADARTTSSRLRAENAMRLSDFKNRIRMEVPHAKEP